MNHESSPEPLNAIIRKLRKPHSLRELMAACLRSIHMGDPFSGDKSAIPETPKHLLEAVTRTDKVIDGVPCQIYAPKDLDSGLPVMLYMHGGGFVIGCADDTDYITRALCFTNIMIVVSVNYRLAPEVVFPGALDDCEKVFNALIAAPEIYGFNERQAFLGGDSAGGNLAMALSQRLKSLEHPLRGLVLLAPWLDMQLEKYASYNVLAPDGIVMDASFLAYARASYVGFRDWDKPQVSPINCDLSLLPPTLIVVGHEDPLVDQALSLRAKEQFGGTRAKQLEVELFYGMPHCFYSFPNVYYEEKECYEKIASFINRVKR